MKHTSRNLPRSRLDDVAEHLPEDPYQSKGKPPGSAACPDCGAVFLRGRWAWSDAPPDAQQHLCPACRRIREQQPAGYVHLEGEFLARHKEEVLNLMRNEEALEKGQHPLQRIIDLHDRGARIDVTTTDVHLARRLGDAVRDAYQGDLEIEHTPGEYMVRVNWSRGT